VRDLTAPRKYTLEVLQRLRATDDAVNDPYGPILSRRRKRTPATHETWHLRATLVLYSACCSSCRCALLTPRLTSSRPPSPQSLTSRIKVRIKRDLQISDFDGGVQHARPTAKYRRQYSLYVRQAGYCWLLAFPPLIRLQPAIHLRLRRQLDRVRFIIEAESRFCASRFSAGTRALSGKQFYFILRLLYIVQ